MGIEVVMLTGDNLIYSKLGKVVSMYSIRNFKFLGFALGKGKNGVYIRAHAKSLKKAKAKLKELTSRSQGRNVRKVMENVKVYIRGWLGYFGIASIHHPFD